jgi:hypothetical protein
MMPETNYGPQRRYNEKQKRLGMVKITTWVPERKRDEALDYLARLREKHTAKVG